ncbi:MAG: DUF5658 family protein [Planctomycetota bacterium]
MFAVFDLLFTLNEWGSTRFVELNPVAARVLSGAIQHIYTFKFGTVAFATVILLSVRRYRVAELGCWLLFAMMLYVGVRWYAYYECVLHGNDLPIIAPE